MNGLKAGPFPAAETDRQIDIGGVETFVGRSGYDAQLSIVNTLGELAKPRHKPILGEVVAACDRQRRIRLPLLQRRQHIAYVTEASPYRIREALAGRSQLEAVTVALEESKTGFALHRRDMTADRRGRDTELGARRRQISMPGGDFEYDERVQGRKRPSQCHHIKIISTSYKISSITRVFIEYKYKKSIVCAIPCP
jgi:hypothetical protein